MQVKPNKERLRNPQGLDQILSEILGYEVHGDWDKDICRIQNIGNIKREGVSGKAGDVWGKLMESTAREYLARNLQQLGWRLRNEKVNGEEYDCIGRSCDSSDKTAELAVEMYFPQPKVGEYSNTPQHSLEMIEKLLKIEAKRKYVLIGAPKDMIIGVAIQPHPTIKTLFQEYKLTGWVFHEQ